MSRFHFFHRETGVLHGRSVVLNVPVDQLKDAARANAPEGHDPIAGDLDAECMRVDIATLQIVEYQPPAPSPEHTWNAELKRWRLPAEKIEQQRRRTVALRRIAELETAQARRVRELLAEQDERLKGMDEEIQALRADL